MNCATNRSLIPNASLENTYWKLVEAGNKKISTPQDSREAHFILKIENGTTKVQGFGGCNGLVGSCETKEDKISFKVASTKMMCPRMETEDAFTKALDETNRYSITGDILKLHNQKTLLATLEAVYF